LEVEVFLLAAHTDAYACKHIQRYSLFPGTLSESPARQVASPGLEGGQVAVLRLHAAVSWLRNDCTILAELGERITQLQYLLQLPLRTLENSVKAKFAEFTFYEVG
jgi:hypothetical protein